MQNVILVGTIVAGLLLFGALVIITRRTARRSRALSDDLASERLRAPNQETLKINAAAAKGFLKDMDGSH